MANTTDWLNISAQSGSSGTTRLTLTARRNTSTDYKLATITAYNPVYNISAQTYVTLESYAPYLAVSPTQLGVPASGGTYELAISGNCEWVIAFPDIVSSYSTSAGTGDTVVTFTIPATQCATTVVANIVVTDETGQISRLCRIEQYAEPISILYNPLSLTFPYYGGPLSFSVSANCLYSIASGQGDWYTFTPTTGTTGETDFTVSATSINSGDTDWTGTINIVGPEGVAAVLMLTQLNQGQYSINYTADTSTIDYSGETRTITIDATDFINSSITVTILDAPDVTYSYSASGLTRGIITLTIPQNPGGERNFKVVVSGRRALSQNYSTAAIQYTQAALQLDFVTDTSNVRGSGEVRTITILNSNINPNRTGLNLPSDFPRQGAYTVSGNVITLTYPANPSSSATRTWTIGVLAQTNDGVSLSGSYQIAQNPNVTYSIPYTADTSTVSESGETRIITIDASNLVSSSITVGVEGATGISATYYNGTVTVVFPENLGPSKNIDVTINGETNNGDLARATVSFSQNAGGLLAIPLRFNIASPGYIYWKKSSTSARTTSIQYRINNGSWTTITSTTGNSAYISVNPGDIVEFIGDNDKYGSGLGLFNSFSCTCSFIASGNVMSLINSTGFSNLYAFTSSYALYHLFDGCTGLTDASNLILPATTLANYCYSYMFKGCTSLTTVPSNYLPVTALTTGCYSYMFAGCTSLTTAPVLPATTLANNCYTAMFQNCTSLTTAPELPATTLAGACYAAMFQGCTGLTTAPALPATRLAYNCYGYMFDNCTSLTTAPELPATRLESSCYQYMFRNCTSLTTAPALPATNRLESYCYAGMFVGCTGLTTAPTLPAKILAESCYQNMFYNCTNLNHIKCLATNISASSCRYNWVRGVAASGTFEKDANMTSWPTGDSGIPVGWIVEDYIVNQIPYTADTSTVDSTGETRTIIIDTSNLVASSITVVAGGGIETTYNNGVITVIFPEIEIGDYRTISIMVFGVTLQGNDAKTTLEYNQGSGLEEYFTMEVIDGPSRGAITLLIRPGVYATPHRTIQYSLNGGDWTNLRSADTSQGSSDVREYVYCSPGDKIRFRGDVSSFAETNSAGDVVAFNYFWCTSTLRLKLSGNIMSLVNSTGFSSANTLLSDYAFYSLFNQGGSSEGAGYAGFKVTDASELLLPATYLSDGCYSYLFKGTPIVYPPKKLPSEYSPFRCYYGMFESCTGLTTAPELPATTLEESCYSDMFYKCTSLTTAPELPATTLAVGCYEYMFNSCTNLNYIKCLATDISATNCTSYWVSGVQTNSGTFVTPSSTNWSTGTSGIPDNWTRVDA